MVVFLQIPTHHDNCARSRALNNKVDRIASNEKFWHSLLKVAWLWRLCSMLWTRKSMHWSLPNTGKDRTCGEKSFHTEKHLWLKVSSSETLWWKFGFYLLLNGPQLPWHLRLHERPVQAWVQLDSSIHFLYSFPKILTLAHLLWTSPQQKSLTSCCIECFSFGNCLLFHLSAPSSSDSASWTSMISELATMERRERTRSRNGMVNLATITTIAIGQSEIAVSRRSA